MKNFIIFNTEKEGSSALVTTLDPFKQVTIISDFIEPFDRHMVVNHPNGPGHDIARVDFIKCLELIYGTSEGDLEQLNAMYGKYRSDCRFDFAKAHPWDLKCGSGESGKRISFRSSSATG